MTFHQVYVVKAPAPTEGLVFLSTRAFCETVMISTIMSQSLYELNGIP